MSHNTIFVRIKWVIILLLTMTLDILPFPILGFLILYILIFRPLWFIGAVLDIYDLKNDIELNNADEEE